MKTLESALIQHAWRLYRKRKFIHRDRDPEKRPREEWNYAAANEGTPQKLGERHGSDVSSQPSEGTDPADTLIQDFQLPRL